MARASIASTACVALVAGCAEPPLPTAPLPPLVREAPTRPRAIAVDAPVLVPGEQLTWDVSWRGLSVGRLQLATREGAGRAPGAAPAVDVRSEFRTHGLAARVASVRHDLTTSVARRSARRASHELDVHGALATVRAWSRPSAVPGFLMVRFRGELYRVDLASPRAEDASLVVEGRVVRASARQEVAMTFSLWLSVESARVPERIEAEHDGDHIVAELIERAL